MKMKLFALAFIAGMTSFISHAEAQLYLRPRAGAALKLNGNNNAFSVGATAGYQWIPMFSTEGTYTRLFAIGNNGQDGHTLRADGVLRVPVGILTPFASLGVGWLNLDIPGGSNSETMALLGGGLSISKFAFLSASIGAQYAIVNTGADFIEPYVSVGIVF